MKPSIGKSKRRILVTGGLGFIGSAVACRLHQDYNVVVLDWKNSAESEHELSEFRRLGIGIHHGDIADPGTWQGIGPCDYVFHAAAQVSAVVSETDPVSDFQSNALGTFMVAEFARRCSASVIYCNSIRVYDQDGVEAAIRDRGVVDESCATVNESQHPQPPFAISKYTGEQYLLRYARMHSVPVISFRMSAIVGPGQIGNKVHGWLSYLAGCAVNDVMFNIYGDGKQTRDVLHISDYVELIELALKKFDFLSGRGGAIYNIGGGLANKLSIEQVVDLLRTDYGLVLKVSYKDPRPFEPKHYVADCGAIAKKGWYPRRNDPKSIISEIVDWYLKRRHSEPQSA